jgi:hypothetical protein
VLTTTSVCMEMPVSRPLTLEDIAINISTDSFLHALRREFHQVAAFTDSLQETFTEGNRPENQVSLAIFKGRLSQDEYFLKIKQYYLYSVDNDTIDYCHDIYV